MYTLMCTFNLDREQTTAVYKLLRLEHNRLMAEGKEDEAKPFGQVAQELADQLWVAVQKSAEDAL